MDGWDVALITFMVTYFLPVLIHWFKSSDNIFAKITFALTCLCINGTIIGWFGMMAIAVEES